MMQQPFSGWPVTVKLTLEPAVRETGPSGEGETISAALPEKQINASALPAARVTVMVSPVAKGAVSGTA